MEILVYVYYWWGIYLKVLDWLFIKEKIYDFYVIKEDIFLIFEVVIVIYRSVFNVGCLDEDRFYRL